MRDGCEENSFPFILFTSVDLNVLKKKKSYPYMTFTI